MSSTKVLITTSGIGSRLGKLTERTNKSLVKVGDKPVIARIIDSYPNDSEFVITLGYFGNHVREFLEIAYPRLKIVFVEVDKYVGDGSSLAYSLYQARDFIEQPFIFHACDTIVPNFEVPKTIHSWVAGKRGVIGTNYASFDAKGDFVSRFKGKGMLDSDYAYIGIAGIKSPEKFWNCVERILDANHAIENPSDLNILTEMLKEGEQFKVQDIDVWYDTGNSESLQTARRSFQHNETILEKSNESVYFIDHSVIKFSIDSEINRKKVERARFLDGVVPPVTSSSQFFFKYGYVDGQPLSECRDPETIAELLDWSWSHLWSKRLASPSRHFSRDCELFYLEKSRKRVLEFCESRQLQDDTCMINSREVPPALTLLEQSRKILLEATIESSFHGDFILDNIIKTPKGFKLIDWRHEFGNSLTTGDIYYDLAKLNHSLHISHRLINSNLFEISFNTEQAQCSVLRTDVSVEKAKKLQEFVIGKQLSWQKTLVLTPIIWLNMAPLHHHPFDQFLYFYGRLKLWQGLREVGEI